MTDATSKLLGTWWVRCLDSAFVDARRLLPRAKDRAILRRHAIKLAYWPEQNPATEHGVVLDIDWSWIKAMKRDRVGELRVSDRLGDRDNLRLIFWVAPRKLERHPMPIIWILLAMQKRRDEFTKFDIRTFATRRKILMERVY